MVADGARCPGIVAVSAPGMQVLNARKVETVDEQRSRLAPDHGPRCLRTKGNLCRPLAPVLHKTQHRLGCQVQGRKDYGEQQETGGGHAEAPR